MSDPERLVIFALTLGGKVAVQEAWHSPPGRLTPIPPTCPELCAFLPCFSGKREKDQVTDRQRLVAVDAAGECQDSLHGALVLPHVEPRAVDRSRPGHGPSLPRLAHAGGFPFSRSAHRHRVRARGGSGAGALAGRLRRRRASSRGCWPGESGVASLPAAAPPASPSRARAGGRAGRCDGRVPAGSRRPATG